MTAKLGKVGEIWASASLPKKALLVAAGGFPMLVLFGSFRNGGGSVSEAPGVSPSTALLERAVELLDKGDSAQAEEFLRASAAQDYNDPTPVDLMRLGKVLSAGSDLRRFDWDCAEGMLRTLADRPAAPQGVRKFSRKKLDWVARERQVAAEVAAAYRLTEQGSFEEALHRIDDIGARHPSSDVLRLVAADRETWKTQLYDEYRERARDRLAAEDPDWDRGIEDLQKALPLAGKQSREVTQTIEEYRKAKAVKEKLIVALTDVKAERWSQAEGVLETILFPGHYERAVENLRDQSRQGRHLLKAHDLYRRGKGKSAVRLLDDLDSPKAKEFSGRITKIEQAMERGTELLAKADFQAAAEAFHSVLELEVDPSNSYRQEAGRLYNRVRKKHQEELKEAFAKGMEAYRKGQYSDTRVYFEKVVRLDREGIWRKKLESRLAGEAPQILREMRKLVFTGAAGGSAVTQLELLQDFLGSNDPHRRDVRKILGALPVPNRDRKGAATEPRP